MALPKDLVNTVVVPYLRGTEIARVELELYYSNLSIKDFLAWPIKGKSARNKINYEELTKNILLELNIHDPEVQKSLIFDPKINNLYDLLIRLYRDGNHHLGRLIQLIDNAKPRSRTPVWVMPAMFFGLLAMIGAFFENYQHTAFMRFLTATKDFGLKAFDWIKGFANVAKNVALVGIAFNALKFLYNSRNIISDQKLTNPQKVYELSFAFLEPFLVVSAYAITYSLSGAMSVIAGALFVSASGLGILKGGLSLLKAYRNASALNKNIDLMSVTEKAQYHRSTYAYKAQRSALLVEIGYALLSTAVITVWCFFPPSLALVAGCFGALTLLQASSSYITTSANTYYDDALQYELRHVEGIDEEKGLDDQLSVQTALDLLAKKGLVPCVNKNPAPITAAVEVDGQKVNTTFTIPEGYRPGTQITVNTEANPQDPSHPQVQLVTKPLEPKVASILPFTKPKAVVNNTATEAAKKADATIAAEQAETAAVTL